MLVKYDPRNMERVYLRDLEGTYWRIPYLDLGLPPISLWELQEARPDNGSSISAGNQIRFSS